MPKRRELPDTQGPLKKEADSQRQQVGIRVSLWPVLRQQRHPSGPLMLRAGRRLGLVCTAHCRTLTMHHSVTLCLEQRVLVPLSRTQLVSQALSL